MITYADIQQALAFNSENFQSNRAVCKDLGIDHQELLSHEDLTNDPNIGPFMDGLIAGLRLAQMTATEDNASYDEFLMGLPENHAS